MAFQLYEIQSEEEFKPIGQLLADGYEQPFNSFWQLLKGETEEERVSRLWQWHQMAPGSHWVAVKDSAGRVVGGSEWILHEANPFKNGNPIPTAYWWSDELFKDVSNQALQNFFSRRPAIMSKPHLLLNICCVAQDTRRKGVGRMMMEWGCNLADKKNVESFIEATLHGMRLSESVGFVQKGAPFILDAELPDRFIGQESAWKAARTRAFSTPFLVVPMWRPIDGKKG